MTDNYKRGVSDNPQGRPKMHFTISAVIAIFLFGCVIGNVWGSHAVRTTYKKTLTNLEDKMLQLETYVYLNFKENGLIIVE